MSESVRNQVTLLLQNARTSDGTTEELLPLVYEELRKLAVAQMAAENPGQTLQPTALVHEAFLRLVGNNEYGLGRPRSLFRRRRQVHAANPDQSSHSEKN